MCQKQLCLKCSSDAMFYCDKNAIWICGKCKRLFSSYMDEITCDEASFHKLLLYLACEQDALRDELINTLPDPRVLVSTEAEDGEEEKGQHKGLSPERRTIYQEVYHMLQAIHPANRYKIPKHILDFIDQARDRDFVPAFDLSKGRDETKKISNDALALFAHLNLEYMSSSEEKEKLQHTYEENEKEFQKDKTAFLCRLITQADKLDQASQNEHSDCFRTLCAEACRVMDYLPVDICSKLFTDEDLIELVRCRNYSYYSEMKDKLLSYDRATEAFEYKGSLDTIRFLRSLAEKNECHEVFELGKKDSKQPTQNDEVADISEVEKAEKLTWDEVSELRKAAKRGDSEAQYRLGAHLYDNETKEKLRWEGFAHLKHAAKAWHAKADTKMKRISHSVDKDSPFFHERVFHEHDFRIFDALVPTLRSEAIHNKEKGDEDILMSAASLYAMQLFTFQLSPEAFYRTEGGDEQDAVAAGEIAAMMNMNGAARVVGEWYLNGTHVERDIERAYFWLEKAARMGDEKAAEFLESENMAVGSERMNGINAWVLWSYPGCVNAIMGEYWVDHGNVRDGAMALQVAVQRGDPVGACRVARLIWDKDREKAMQVIREAWKNEPNAETAMFMGRVHEDEGDYAKAYDRYYLAFSGGLSEGLYRLACLCYDGKFQPGEKDGKEEAAGWLEYGEHIRTPKTNHNTYIYPARKENFSKTKLARKCIRKLSEDETFREKYGSCTLDEMVEQARANEDIDLKEE